MFMKSALVWAMKRINSGSEVGHVYFLFFGGIPLQVLEFPLFKAFIHSASYSCLTYLRVGR